MVPKPLAVLRYTWKKNASHTDSLATKWTDNQFDAVFKGSGSGWSIAECWRDATLGIFDLSGSKVFPWKTLNMTHTTGGGTRGSVFIQAVQQALDDRIPIGEYEGVVVWVHPPPCDAGAVRRNVGGREYVGVVLDVNASISYYAQEIGHVIMTWDHSWGPTGEYKDPYCVMSGMDWAGMDPTYQRAVADPSLGSTYWSRTGPMVAAAMLTNYVPHFSNSYSKASVDQSYATSPKLVTLSALSDARHRLSEAAPGSPAVAVIPAGPTEVYVEYRRQHGWDQGLDSTIKLATGQAGPTPGVVVHQLDSNAHVTYRNFIPLPTLGKGDWSDPAIDLTIQIAGFDPTSPEQVTIRVGGAALAADRRVELEIGQLATMDMYRHTSDHETFGPPNDMCPDGTYEYYTHERSQRIRCQATAFGFDNPVFAWSIDGVSVGPGESQMAAQKSVVAPLPHGAVNQVRSVDLACTANRNVLEIYAEGGQGSFAVTVNVFVSEQSDANKAARMHELAGFETESLRFEQRYYDDLDACLTKIQEVGEHKLKDSPFRKFIDKGDPLASWLGLSERESLHDARLTFAALAERDPDLAQQYADVASRRLGVPHELLMR